MKFKTNHYFLVAFFALLLCLSCDDEQLDPNLQNTIETILPNTELANLMEDVSSLDSFECVDFQYPIFFTLYNSNFQVVETVTIQSDDALLSFLQSLGVSDNGVVLASLNFPVTLVYDNGTQVEVEDNQELEAGLLAAENNCGEAEGCDMETVRDYLIACPQIPTLNTFTPSFTTFEFYDSNELFSLYELDLPHGGTWDIAVIEGELMVFINFNGLENFNGEWNVVGCDSDQLVLQQGDDTLILAKQCENENPLECLSSTDAQLVMCDEFGDGSEVFDLTQVFANCLPSPNYELMYYPSLQDAQAGTNQIPNPSNFANTMSPQTIYVKVSFEGTEFSEIFEINLILEDCDCNNPATLTNDLIIYMPFSEQAKDLISNYIVPNVSNTYVEDRNGNSTCAISFDGTNSFSIPVTAQNQIVQGDSFAISLWFKMQNTEAGDLEVFFRSPGDATQGFQLGVYDLNSPLFFDNLGTSIWDNDWNQEIDVLWDNTDWHHLVATVDANNTIKLYRDGVLRNTIENSNFSVGSQPASMYLFGEGFQGYLDDLRVYKRTLSPNEIFDLYNLEGDCYQCL